MQNITHYIGTILKIFHLRTEKKALDIAPYSRNFMRSTSGSRPEVYIFSSPDSVQFLLSYNYVLQNPLSLILESRNQKPLELFLCQIIIMILNSYLLFISYLKQVYELVSSVFQVLQEYVLISLQNNTSVAVPSIVPTTLSLA